MLVNTRRPLMSYEPPMPPVELPTDLVDTLNGYPLSSYSTLLATLKS